MKNTLISFRTLALFTAVIFMAFSAQAADISRNTAEFIQKASAAGAFEVESSKMALQKSGRDDVRTFARQMVEDHTKAGDRLKSLVRRMGQGRVLQRRPDRQQQQIERQLGSSDGWAFDRDYISAQRDAHRDAVDLFSDYARHGDNRTLRRFADDTLPVLQGHRRMVENLPVRREESRWNRDQGNRDRDHDNDNHRGWIGNHFND
jgi:putative membrane protein